MFSTAKIPVLTVVNDGVIVRLGSVLILRVTLDLGGMSGYPGFLELPHGGLFHWELEFGREMFDRGHIRARSEGKTTNVIPETRFEGAEILFCKMKRRIEALSRDFETFLRRVVIF